MPAIVARAQPWRCGKCGRFGQGRIAFGDHRVRLDLGKGCQRAETQAAARLRNATREAIGALDVNQLPRRHDVGLHQRQQAGSACQQADRAVAVLAKALHDVVDRAGAVIVCHWLVASNPRPLVA
nr:hypothetical protein [Nitrolancea hollandica]